MDKQMKRLITIMAVGLILLSIMVIAAYGADNSRPAFPQKNGVQLRYRHYDASGKMDARCVITLRNVKGDMENGSLDMVYNCYDEKGKPYFGDSNEFVMQIKRKESQTYITMDKMAKTLKVMDLISTGDVSTIRVPMKVDSKLSDSKIFTTLGIFKATLTISERKVVNHKTLKIGDRSYDSYLVHEKVLTVTPFGKDVATADTWYAEGVGVVSQKVYDAKGKLKGRLELY